MRLADSSRMIRFALVGVSGLGVNMSFLWFFTAVCGIDYRISSPPAVELAILSNFMLNNFWTFHDSVSHSSFRMRLVKFHFTAFGGFVINYAVLVGLTELAGLYYLLSNLVGIMAGFLWNYAVNVKWTWRQAASRGPQPPR